MLSGLEHAVLTKYGFNLGPAALTVKYYVHTIAASQPAELIRLG